MKNKILQGDIIELVRTLAAKSVNTIITSPPYFGLRDYDLPPTDWPEVTYAPMAGLPELTIPAMTCCLGLEDSIEAYVGHMLLVFRELWRVLRGDGVAWLNLGDSYTSSSKDQCNPSGNTRQATLNNGLTRPPIIKGLPPKNLCGIPWRVAFALQADGWFLRSDIIWAKKNGLPESVRDRPTKAHEYLFLLAKSERYYYDADAIREPLAREWNDKNIGINNMSSTGIGEGKILGRKTMPNNGLVNTEPNPAGRNKRTVWTYIDQIAEHNELFAFTLARLVSDHPELLDSILDEYGATSAEKSDVWHLSSQNYKGAHFAVMPEALVEPCLLAGCPAQVCVECGEPWVRVVKKIPVPRNITSHRGKSTWAVGAKTRNDTDLTRSGQEAAKWKAQNPDKFFGFTPTCKCSAPTRPGIVLDPFFGSGTVGRVAKKNKRDWLGIELNPAYAELARKRLDQTQPALFAT